MSKSYIDAIYSDKKLRISNSHIKKPNSKKKCVYSDLVNAINLEITGQKLPHLGFDQTNPANKEWLLNVLYTLNPEHELFLEDEKLKITCLLNKLDKKYD